MFSISLTVVRVQRQLLRWIQILNLIVLPIAYPVRPSRRLPVVSKQRSLRTMSSEVASRPVFYLVRIPIWIIAPPAIKSNKRPFGVNRRRLFDNSLPSSLVSPVVFCRILFFTWSSPSVARACRNVFSQQLSGSVMSIQRSIHFSMPYRINTFDGHSIESWNVIRGGNRTITDSQMFWCDRSVLFPIKSSAQLDLIAFDWRECALTSIK